MKCLLLAIFLLSSVNFVLASEKIDINTAPMEDLLKIIHIGEARALELISLRPFSSLDDLARIKGIGEKRIEDIKSQGLAWVASLKNSSLPISTTTEVAESDPPQTLIDYPAGVIINEIMPSPAGPDDREEWIEIFNKNNFEVNLSGWRIADIAGKTETYTFPEETIITSVGFLVLSRLITKITLNNQGDGLRLIQPDGDIADEVNYENAPREESYGFFDSGWTWISNPTPGSANIFPTPPAPAQEKKVAEKQPPQTLAAIGEQTPKNSNNSFLLLAAIFTSLFGGVIILILKRYVRT